MSGFGKRKRKPWGKMAAGIIAGLVLLGCGLVVGLTSHQVTFATISYPDVSGAIVGGGTDYLVLKSQPYVFIINEGGLNPAFTSADLNGTLVSLSVRTDETSDVHETAQDGFHIDGEGLTVVGLTVLSDSEITSTYSSSEFTAHPFGYYDNLWGFAAPFLAIGGLFILLASFVPHRIFTVLQWTFGGAFALSILGLVFAGVTVPDKLMLAAYVAAIADDLAVILVCALLGAGIGFLIGIVQAVRGGGFAGEGIESAFAVLGEIQSGGDD